MSSASVLLRGVQGVALTMPQRELEPTSLSMKNGSGTINTSQQAAFWTVLEASHSSEGYETTALTSVADTNEQTILDVTDAGILTHVIGPVLSSTGFLTIRVTVDGNLLTPFVSEIMVSSLRFCLGFFGPSIAVTVISQSASLGGGFDSGFLVGSSSLLPTPPQAINEANFGVKFDSSVKVTIQGSVSITGTAELNKAAANYLTPITRGI